jgi:NhaA family Na+:H+ antiporter
MASTGQAVSASTADRERVGGLLLLVAAATALIWANSAWASSYAALWHTPLGVRAGSLAFERDLHFWINDGLMALFFFVVGREIRHEVDGGELSTPRRAALPLAAALGGMLVPAIIYLGFNAGRPSLSGWGIPMATDIAFAVGVLALLGRRVPGALRILLLALAVIDDIGAIVVIALFYSSGVVWSGIGVAAGGALGVVALRGLGVRAAWAYLVPGVVVWIGALGSGVHPTLAGVVVGLLVPPPASADSGQRWVTYGILPLFALANAGVPLGTVALGGDGLRVFLGVALGLALGKPLGVLALTWAAARAGWASAPTGLGWARIGVVGLVAGIGFTMSLFIAQLALPAGPLLETAKLAILVGSAGAAVVGYAVGVRVLRGGR